MKDAQLQVAIEKAIEPVLDRLKTAMIEFADLLTDLDGEWFCCRCTAGVDSSQHHELCASRAAGNMGECALHPDGDCKP